MVQAIVPSDKKIGDLGGIAMPPRAAAEWFGAPPPDLTLVARKRSPEWVYTYMKTFYVDPTRPLGVNNKVFPKVGMPHVLEPLQGLQRAVWRLNGWQRPHCSGGFRFGAANDDSQCDSLRWMRYSTAISS